MNYLIHHGIKGMKWGIRKESYHDSTESGRHYKRIMKGARVDGDNDYKPVMPNPKEKNLNTYPKKLSKKEKQLANASKYAKNQAKIDKINAEDYHKERDAQTFRNQYMKNGKFDSKKYLQDNFGDDWNKKEYLKDVFEIDDPHKWAHKDFDSNVKSISAHSRRMESVYIESAKKNLEKSDRWKNTPVSQISKSEFKEVKKYAKRQVHDEKREAKRAKKARRSN